MTHWLDRVVLILTSETADLRALAKIAGADPRTFYRGIRREDLELDGQNIEGMEFAGENATERPADEVKTSERFTPADEVQFVAGIHAASPKEERVARLVEALLLFPEDFEKILDACPHFSMFEARAVTSLRTCIRSSRKLSRDRYDAAIARAMSALFNYAINDARGKFMLALASHCGSTRAIRELIEAKLDKTYSYRLLAYEKQIRAALLASA